MRLTGLNPYLLELVNLREQCTRVHQQQPELANRKAQELVRVAVGRVLAAQPDPQGQESVPAGSVGHRRRGVAA